jgi:hypothetical protein
MRQPEWDNRKGQPGPDSQKGEPEKESQNVTRRTGQTETGMQNRMEGQEFNKMARTGLPKHDFGTRQSEQVFPLFSAG